MKQWATRQMKSELLTSKAAAFMGVAMVFLIALVIGAANGIKNEMRVLPVSTAAQAMEVQAQGRIAELEYEEKILLGTLTLETTTQGEVAFMMGGAAGAVPGMTRTYEEDYRLWALKAEDFTALCFSRGEEIPDAGKLRMDSLIGWLKEEERAELIREFSDGDVPAYVFLLEEINGTRWAVFGFLAFAFIFCVGAIMYLLLTKRAFKMTKLWKAMAKAGDPEKIREEMDEPIYARLGFAVSTNYVCVSGRVFSREGMQCVMEEDDTGDGRYVFTAANGWSAEYYPEQDELETLNQLFDIKK